MGIFRKNSYGDYSIENMELASVCINTGMYRMSLIQQQQALELMFKHLICVVDINVDRNSIKTHDLALLRNICGINLTKEEIEVFRKLNKVYSDLRYPSERTFDVNKEDTEMCFELTNHLLEVLITRISEIGVKDPVSTLKIELDNKKGE